MACKYVKEFDFGAATKAKGKPFATGGVAKTVTKEMEYDYKTGKKSFTGSVAKRDAHAEKEGKMVAKHLAYDKSKNYAEGGSVKADLKQDKKMIAQAVHKHEKAQHPGKPLTKLKKGGKVTEKATGERYASKMAMEKHEKMETPRMQREEMMQKRVVRGPAMAAGRDPRAALIAPAMKCGGMYKKGK